MLWSICAKCEQSLKQTSSSSYSYIYIFIPFSPSPSRRQDWCPLAVLSTKSRSRLMSSLCTGFTSLLYSSPRTTIFWRSRLLQERPYSGEQDWINLISSSTKYFYTIVFHKICLDLTKDPWWWNVVLYVLYIWLTSIQWESTRSHSPRIRAQWTQIITIAHWFWNRRFLSWAFICLPACIQYLDPPDT